MDAKQFVVQPGGTSREAKDGGYIFPVHLDAAFVTEFYPYWREDGISFMLVPFVEKSKPAAPETVTVPHSGETPAQILHARFFKLLLFWEFLEHLEGAVHINDSAQAKMAFKHHYDVDSCSEITRDKLEEIVTHFNAWIPTRGNHE